MILDVVYHDGAKELEILPKGDWVDLRANETVELKAGDFALISLGISVRIPEGYEAHLAPRSSTFKKWGVIQANSVGVIDNSYSGTNDIWKYPVIAMRDTKIHKGDRIAQFRIIERQPKLEFNKVTKLNDVDRGGFGSSGTN